MQMRKQGGLNALSNAIGETENIKPDLPDEIIDSPEVQPAAVFQSP
jgi:hypothetical protein